MTIITKGDIRKARKAKHKMKMAEKANNLKQIAKNLELLAIENEIINEPDIF